MTAAGTSGVTESPDVRPREQESDEELLSRFGYKQELTRGLGLWTNWAVGFAFISPVVGLYAIIGLGVTTAGPPWV